MFMSGFGQILTWLSLQPYANGSIGQKIIGPPVRTVSTDVYTKGRQFDLALCHERIHKICRNSLIRNNSAHR